MAINLHSSTPTAASTVRAITKTPKHPAICLLGALGKSKPPEASEPQHTHNNRLLQCHDSCAITLPKHD